MTTLHDTTSRSGPSLRSTLVQPRSLGLLLLALLLSAAFAGLGQWQLGRAVQAGTVVPRTTETVRDLTAVAQPQRQQTDASVGQLVRARGRLLPADTLVASDRLNRGQRGYWVVGHAIVDDPAGAQLAVALGWTADRATADRVAARIRTEPAVDGPLAGRFVDSDPAQPSTSGPPNSLDSVSTAQLLNLWTTDANGPVYEGVLTLHAAPAGLDAIYSPRPGEQVELNLINVLYAIEWAFFAVAAIYVWYRLVRDRWEQERAVREAVDDELDELGDRPAEGASARA